MSHIYDSTSRYRPHVHWNDEPIARDAYTNITKHGSRISLSASLPFHSKLNIRLQANRFDRNDNQVRARATIERLDPRYEHEHLDAVRQAYVQHYSTLPVDELQRMQLERLPRHRQISLPICLPVNQRLFLYIHDGEVYARC